MVDIQIFEDLLNKEICSNMPNFFNRLHSFFLTKTPISTQPMRSDLIDKDFIAEIENVPENVSVFFGKTLKDLKLCITDENQREHDIYVRYLNRHKLVITAVNLPNSSLQDTEYSSIEEVATIFRNYINRLTPYFQELENIDHHCNVVEPIKPTFKDDYRKISIGPKTWLHIEVTSDGLARNIHLIGQTEQMQDTLQKGLLQWDHDRDIVENINSIFNMLSDDTLKPISLVETNANKKSELPICGICFCVELPDCLGLPQPLCQNINCGIYYHRSCIFQWLVACEGNRSPAFGVANGKCPTCLQSMTCSEREQ